MILFELINYSKEYWDMKMQLDDLGIELAKLQTPLWKQIIITGIPVIAIISGFFVGWLVPTNLFKRNAEKSKDDDIRKLYSKIAGLNTTILYTLKQMNLDYIQASFFYHLISLTDDQTHRDFYITENQRHDELQTKAVSEMKEYIKEYSTCVAEYTFYNTDSKANDLLSQIFVVDFLADFKEELSNGMNHDELTDTKNKMKKEIPEYLGKTYVENLSNLASVIYLETKTKKKITFNLIS